MGFFQFGRKMDIGLEISLEDIPIFSSLTPAEQKIIEKKARLLEYKRGDIVYEEGTEADAFYVVSAGRFRLFNRPRGDRPEQTLLNFYRGDHFGETSLLTGRPHSATVEAKSDGLILKLEKKDFLRLVNEMPAISLHLNRSLGHRLTMSAGGTRRREVKISALYAKGRNSQDGHLWFDFARNLMEVGRGDVVLIDFVSPVSPLVSEQLKKGNIPAYQLSTMEPSRESDLRNFLIPHPSGFHYLHVGFENAGDREEKRLSALLSSLTARYDHLLLQLPWDNTHLSFRALKQSDEIYLYSRPEVQDLVETSRLVGEFEKAFGFSRSEIKVLVPEDDNGNREITFEEKERLLGQRIFSLVPDRHRQADRYDANLRYLAKELSGNLTGLALGSGAAYGLAHIGVLRVLEQENIQIDVVAGSSIGALVGAIWAAGYNADQLEEFAFGIDKKTAFFKIFGFADLSIAHHGFFKGQKLHHFLAPYLGDKTFQDLKIPLRVTATNLFTAEEVIFRAGKVTDAIRASVSIPGIFRPFQHEGQLLIDGGVIDPLPVRVLSKLGVKKIIGVNVLPSPMDWAEKHKIQQEKYRKRMEMVANKNFWDKAVTNQVDRFHKRYSDNIFNVIMNTIQFMEFEMAEVWGKKADILLHPMVPDAHWAQFYYPQKFIKAGEEVARAQINEIKQLLAE
ncbi:MAG TPA: patatin-like phospholipase family protein [Verrucomicrobiae bacterium]|jgi:NTE family protein|nr:patatin-like phospholipase family protein [Verrucomicrobiae bacterium]